MSSGIPMTGKQRYLCALNHIEPDYVPIYESPYSKAFFRHVLGYAPETLDPVNTVKLAQKVGYDVITVNMGGMAGYSEPGMKANVYKDEWGVTYQKDEAAWPMDGPIASPLTDGEDWKNYDFPDPTKPSRYTEVADAIKLANETGTAVIGGVRGPFTGTWMLFGMENFACMLYEEPEVVDEILTKVCDFAIYGAVKMTELGASAIQIADDYGSNIQPMISPAMFDRFVAPQLKRLVDAIHKAGGRAALHSDGHIKPLLPTIVGTGIDSLHPIQRGAGMNIAEVKKEYGKKIAIMGNVDNRHLIVHGKPEEVAAQTIECLRIAAPGGGYILCSDHSLHDDVPYENAIAIYETGRKYGKYPICL